MERSRRFVTVRNQVEPPNMRDEEEELGLERAKLLREITPFRFLHGQSDDIHCPSHELPEF